MTERNPDPSLLNDLMEMFSDSHIDRLTYRAAKEITRLDADNERLRSQVEALEGERDYAWGEMKNAQAYMRVETNLAEQAEASLLQARQERDRVLEVLEAERSFIAEVADGLSWNSSAVQCFDRIAGLFRARKATVHTALTSPSGGNKDGLPESPSGDPRSALATGLDAGESTP